MTAETTRCIHCRRTIHVIEGDGPPVCQVCVLTLGGAAGDPYSVSDTLRLVLRRKHRTTVALAETPNGKAVWVPL